jgi:hypothetical protein
MAGVIFRRATLTHRLRVAAARSGIAVHLMSNAERRTPNAQRTTLNAQRPTPNVEWGEEAAVRHRRYKECTLELGPGGSIGTEFAAKGGMAATQLDQFIHALIWKAGPLVTLCSLGAIVLRQLLRRLGRRAMRAIHAARTGRKPIVTPPCPSCDRPMVKRTVRRGSRAGAEFWGCSNYPMCTDTRSV